MKHPFLSNLSKASIEKKNKNVMFDGEEQIIILGRNGRSSKRTKGSTVESRSLILTV